MVALLSVQEAQERILAAFQVTGTEQVPIDACAGRILAVQVCAPGDLPPFTNSSMDGFAVRAADVASAAREQPVALKIAGDIPAGGAALVLNEPGSAARIMTGAPLPEGADAVIPVEDTNWAAGATGALDPDRQDGLEVMIYRSVQPGDYIRPRGQDVREGQCLLDRGRKLQPQDAGLLASLGQAQVEVYRRPRVALFSSGDELVPPGQPLGEGKIYDSNQYVLAALLEQEGAEVIRLGTAPDEPGQIKALLSQAVGRDIDLIVTSAGVSVGAFDFVRSVIEENGTLDFWRVNMRPGKPVAFGAFAGIPLIGLPGNPVSAYVGCRVFVLPAIYKLAGRTQILPRTSTAVLGEDIESDGRESYLRAVVTRDMPVGGARMLAKLTGHQGSGNIYSLVQANALLIVPSGVKSLPSGSEVNIWFLDED